MMADNPEFDEGSNVAGIEEKLDRISGKLDAHDNRINTLERRVLLLRRLGPSLVLGAAFAVVTWMLSDNVMLALVSVGAVVLAVRRWFNPDE